MGRTSPTAAAREPARHDDRATREAAAVRAERALIARELHDIIAHDLSVMLVQTAAAKRMAAADPVRARSAIAAVEETGREAQGELRRLLAVLGRGDAELAGVREGVEAVAQAVALMIGQAGAGSAALATVETTGRTALTELRSLLAVLRADGEDVAHAPQPSLERLGALVARSRDAGLQVELRTEGEPGPLAPGIDLTAFRLVQEGLANALAHGGRGRARVTVRWADDAIEVEVANRIDGRPAAEMPRAGHGLARMRERAALFGGVLHAGPIGRGFVMRARLPR